MVERGKLVHKALRTFWNWSPSKRLYDRFDHVQPYLIPHYTKRIPYSLISFNLHYIVNR